MSMLDENCFAGLACAETHNLGSENVQNRNMSLVLKISAARNPIRDVSSSHTQIPWRPLHFNLPKPTSTCNINHVGLDHHCFHSSNVVLWGDVFGDAPVHPDDAFNPRSRRPRLKRPKLSDGMMLHPFRFPTARPAAPLTHVPAAQAPLRPPSFGRSVPLRAPAPASHGLPSGHFIPTGPPSQLTASRSALPQHTYVQAPTITPASLINKEAGTNVRCPPPPRPQKKQSESNFLSFTDDGIQSIKPRDRRVGSSSVANVDVEKSLPLECMPRADVPVSYGGFTFPGQVSLSGSSDGEA